jgi:small conductance mechanosensitive channel
MEKDISKYMDMATDFVSTYGMNVIGALVILFIGFTVAKWAGKIVTKQLGKKLDETLTTFFAKMISVVIKIFTVLAVLDRFGVETAGLLTILGAASLAIGLALQGTLSNMAAGVMILVFRPFKIGQVIDAAGHRGTVKSLGLFVTELATPDNLQVIVPNGLIWGTSIMNLSHHDTRRTDMVVGIGYDDDIDKALKILAELTASEGRIFKDPAPMIVVSELGASSVDILVRYWTKSSDLFPTKFDLTKTIKQRFDKDGISFPYPQQDVHMYNETQ